MGTFYSQNPDVAWRFGDVVRGLQVVIPQIDKPAVEGGDLQIHVRRPLCVAVLTPCCKIEEKAVLVAPLQFVKRTWLDNPYFAADLTRINGKVPAEHSLSPTQWEKMPEHQRQIRLAKEDAYVSDDCFVYADHDLLPKYTLTSVTGEPTLGHYMVDFKTMFRFQCDVVRDRQTNRPPGGLKILQLDIETRALLRQKLVCYFDRVAEEDGILV